MRQLQSVLDMLYPPQCAGCATLVDAANALCPACWSAAHFITGLACDRCGAPQIGRPVEAPVTCDDCLKLGRPWDKGRAAMLYKDKGRALVLALKHADRLDLVGSAADWLARAAQDVLTPDKLIVPVPAHWVRLVSRRYNQAALLARALAKTSGADFLPDALLRTRRTEVQDGKTVDARFQNLHGAIRPHPKRAADLAHRNVLLVDDVMTSGATFAAATEACLSAGAQTVSVVSLARVVKDA